MKQIFILAVVQALGFSSKLIAAPEGRSADASATWVISQLIETAGGKTLAMIEIDDNAGLDVGMTLACFRTPGRNEILSPIEQKIAAETGLLKIREVGPQFALAEVLHQGSYLSQALYPKFPGVMSGDRVFLKPLSISARKFVIPEAVASYFALFADPKASPSTFELSPSGIVQLRGLAGAFHDKKASLLMVEGHTDHHGAAEVNQVESYQRALAVRQFLIDHMGFDPKRVLAVGYGESEMADESMVEGSIEKNRRIVLKITAE